MRFAQGFHEYKYLQDTNYPIPVNRIWTKHFGEFKFKFGGCIEVTQA